MPRPRMLEVFRLQKKTICNNKNTEFPHPLTPRKITMSSKKRTCHKDISSSGDSFRGNIFFVWFRDVPTPHECPKPLVCIIQPADSPLEKLMFKFKIFHLKIATPKQPSLFISMPPVILLTYLVTRPDHWGCVVTTSELLTQRIHLVYRYMDLHLTYKSTKRR